VGRKFILTNIFVTIWLLGCVTDSNKNASNTKFKIGLYQGVATIADKMEYFETYLRSDGKYEIYQYYKLADYDSIVCWAKSEGSYIDSGDAIKIYDIKSSERTIDSLKDVKNIWSDWEPNGNITGNKKSIYKSYGQDFFTGVESGGDSNGNTWNVEIYNKWIGSESTPLPFNL
jgi:hypothetical protein